MALAIERRQIIFRCVDLAFPQLCCPKFSFKPVDISKSYARKQKGLFFLSMFVFERNFFADARYALSPKLGQA